MLECLNLTSWLLGICGVCVGIFWSKIKSGSNIPPGPLSLPVIGYLPFMRAGDPLEVINTIREKYGNIVSFYIGRDLTVFLSDYEVIKEAFQDQALQDRPPSIFDFSSDGGGFAALNGQEWIEQRRYAMKTLKDIGMSSNPWQKNLEAEVEDFLKNLEEHSGKPIEITDLLLSSVSNNMISIVLGRRLLVTDQRRKDVVEGILTTSRLFTSSASLVFYFPKILKFFAKLGMSRLAKDYRALENFNNVIRNEINQRKQIMAKGESGEEIFLDGYLQEIKKNEEKNLKTYFNERNLCGTAKTLVVGGSDTSRSTIEWLILAMASNQDIQKRVQDEIEKVLGIDGKIMWMERAKLPYTYATTMEVLRWRTTAPLGVVHRARVDTKIRGYDIPRGTNVLAYILALHNDPKYWKDPEKFNPERFLDKRGALIMDRLPSYMPFSIGRRICPGEMVAMIKVFRYFTGILQRFNIRPLQGKPVDLDGLPGSTFQPAPQKIIFILRR